MITTIMSDTNNRAGSDGNSKITIPWTLFLHIAITIVTIATAWGSISAKFDGLSDRVRRLEDSRASDIVVMQELRSQLAIATQKLLDFKEDYERDANRYIRDANDKRK